MASLGKAQKRKTTRAAPTSYPAILADQAVLDAGVALLAERDAALVVTLLAERGAPALRRREPGFEGLATIIVSQQVSTASANAIFARFKTRLGTVDAATYLATSEADLRLCGLSAPKMRALRAIADAVHAGGLDFAALALADAEAAHQSLTAIKGIGPWTADIFLLFCLGHADAWPAGDLALQEGARLALGLAERPTTKELVAIAERWRPLRGVVAHCLWAYYAATKKRAATLEDIPAPKAVAKPMRRVPTRPANKAPARKRHPKRKA